MISKQFYVYVLKEKADKEADWKVAFITLFRSEAQEWKQGHSPRWSRYRDFEAATIDIPEHIYREAEHSLE